MEHICTQRLVPPPHGREAPPVVGGVRPSRCPRAMGKSAGKSVDWTKWALANYYYDFVIPTTTAVVVVLVEHFATIR
jgi:hypothetical protein